MSVRSVSVQNLSPDEFREWQDTEKLLGQVKGGAARRVFLAGLRVAKEAKERDRSHGRGRQL